MTGPCIDSRRTRSVSIAGLEPSPNVPVVRQAQERRDLLTVNSPQGLRLVQVTTDPAQMNTNIYSETPVFTPDSGRFVFQRLYDLADRGLRTCRRAYFLCDIADNFALRQLTDEPTAIAPVVSPDGQWMYYFLQPEAPGQPGAALKRVSLSSFQRETLLVFDRPLPGTRCYPGIIYPLSTISSDGARLATSAFLGNGHQAGAPWGLIVTDLQKGTADVVLEGPDYNNMHPQYCRSKDSAAGHDLMVQHNHGSFTETTGKGIRLGGGDPLGADLHVIRDDGSNWREVPCGRDPGETCHGHEAWRGGIATICAGVDTLEPSGPRCRRIIETKPVAAPEASRHRGKNLPGAWRNDITRSVHLPQFGHLAFDQTGTRFISDCRPHGKAQGRDGLIELELWVGALPAAPDAVLRTQYLLDPRTTDRFGQASHVHPFFSPDGRRAFFNSDYTGLPQIWMVEGFEHLVAAEA